MASVAMGHSRFFQKIPSWSKKPLVSMAEDENRGWSSSRFIDCRKKIPTMGSRRISNKAHLSKTHLIKFDGLLYFLFALVSSQINPVHGVPLEVVVEAGDAQLAPSRSEHNIRRHSQEERSNSSKMKELFLVYNASLTHSHVTRVWRGL